MHRYTIRFSNFTKKLHRKTTNTTPGPHSLLLPSLWEFVNHTRAKGYMNNLEVFLLSNLALLCYVYYLYLRFQFLPLSCLPEYFIYIQMPKCRACSKHLLQKVMKANFMGEADLKQSSANDTPTAGQPLIQQTSTVLSYGTHTNSN